MNKKLPGTRKVIEDTLIYKSTEGTIKLPLKMNLKQSRKLNNLPDEYRLDFMISIFPEKAQHTLDELDILEATEILQEWDKAFEKRINEQTGAGDSLGKSGE